MSERPHTRFFSIDTPALRRKERPSPVPMSQTAAVPIFTRIVNQPTVQTPMPVKKARLPKRKAPALATKPPFGWMLHVARTDWLEHHEEEKRIIAIARAWTEARKKRSQPIIDRFQTVSGLISFRESPIAGPRAPLRGFMLYSSINKPLDQARELLRDLAHVLAFNMRPAIAELHIECDKEIFFLQSASDPG